MSSLRAQWTQRAAPVWVAGVATVLFGALGFRGFGPRGLRWVEEGGPLLSLIPGLHPGWMAAMLGLLCGVVSTVLVFALARRVGGAACGWIAVVMVMTASPWLGLFTRGDPGALVVPLVLFVVLLWFGGGRWWHSGLLGGVLLGIGLYLWPPMAICAGVLLLVLVATAPAVGRATSQAGFSSGAALPLGRLLILVVAFAVLLGILHGGGDLLSALGNHFEAMLLAPTETILFRGGIYPPSRPPLYFGLALCLEALPLLTALAIVTGVLFVGTGHQQWESHFLALGLAALGILVLFLPVFLRGGAPGEVEAAALFLGLAAPLGARSATRFFVAVLSARAPTMKVRQVAIAVYCAVAFSVLVEVPGAVALPEAHRSALTARLFGWSLDGDQPHREVVLPLRLLRKITQDVEGPVWSSGWEEYLDVYMAMGVVHAGAVASSAEEAAVGLRAMTAVQAGPFGVYPAAHPRALEGSRTTPWPSSSRPLYLIDQRLD